MIGTGTKTDPYIPENWDEFVTAVGKSGTYVELPEGGGVFDMNDIAPRGVGNISWCCTNLEGNDWTIQNAHNMTINLDNTTIWMKVSNLNIINFLDERDQGWLTRGNQYNDITFYNCQFSGEKISNGNNYVFSVGTTLYSCGINIIFGGNERRLMDDYYTRQCTFCKGVLDYSGCTSNFNFTTASDGGYRFENSFFRIKTNPEKAQTFEISKYWGNKNIYLIDEEIENGKNIVQDVSGTAHEVTEEQLKNVTYLRSIGFPIVGD